MLPVACIAVACAPAPSASGSDSPPTSNVAPSITDDGSGEGSLDNPVSADVLTCNPGLWSAVPDPTFSYQWNQVAGTSAIGTAATYTIQTRDIGFQLQCAVTATNPAGSASQDSNETGPVGPPPP